MTDGVAVENNMSDNKPESIFSRFTAWVARFGAKGSVAEENVLRIDKSIIMNILPHRGRWLLLDSVEITLEKVAGFFSVTKEVCDGHAIGEDAVLPGVLLAEIANQLLGVWYATQHPEIIGTGKLIFARTGDYEQGKDIGAEESEIYKKARYKASGFIRPGDLLQIEIPYANLLGTMKTMRRGTFMEISGKDFVFKVKEELVGLVGEVVLKGVESPKTTPPAGNAS